MTEKSAHRSIGKMGSENDCLAPADKIICGAKCLSTTFKGSRKNFISIGVAESHSCDVVLVRGQKSSGYKVYELCSLAIFELHHQIFK